MSNPMGTWKSHIKFAQLSNSLSMGGRVGWRGRSICRLRGVVLVLDKVRLQ